MAFSEPERAALLAVKGVGPIVIQRFEEVGIDTLSALATDQVDEIAESIAAICHTTCWKNSPQAKSAIHAAIQRAKAGL